MLKLSYLHKGKLLKNEAEAGRNSWLANTTPVHTLSPIAVLEEAANYPAIHHPPFMLETELPKF